MQAFRGGRKHFDQVVTLSRTLSEAPLRALFGALLASLFSIELTSYLAVTDSEGERPDQARSQQGVSGRDFDGLYSSLQVYRESVLAQGPPAEIVGKEAAVLAYRWILARMIREGADPCNPVTNDPMPTFLYDPKKSARGVWNSIRHLTDPDHDAHSSATEAFQHLDGFIKFKVLDSDSEEVEEQLERVRRCLHRLKETHTELTS